MTWTYQNKEEGISSVIKTSGSTYIVSLRSGDAWEDTNMKRCYRFRNFRNAKKYAKRLAKLQP